ncbi:FAR-17a/AIG1-like protein, partial [Protomyces lactucae-debilis]
HALSVALLTYPYSYILRNPNEISSAYGWHFQFLTILTLTIAYIQFMLACLHDLTGNETILELKQILLLIAGPVELLISVLWWGLKLVDPTLLIPEELLKVFPLSADLSMHANPAILLLIEIFFVSDALEHSTTTAAAIYAAYGTGYLVWLEHCAKMNGFYAYPMLGLMTQGQRIATFAGATAFAFASLLVVKQVY